MAGMQALDNQQDSPCQLINNSYIDFGQGYYSVYSALAQFVTCGQLVINNLRLNGGMEERKVISIKVLTCGQA
jgi:hypothetical protein